MSPNSKHLEVHHGGDGRVCVQNRCTCSVGTGNDFYIIVGFRLAGWQVIFIHFLDFPTAWSFQLLYMPILNVNCFLGSDRRVPDDCSIFMLHSWANDFFGQEPVNTSNQQESQWLPEDCGFEWGTCPSQRSKGWKTLEGWRFMKNEGIWWDIFSWNQANRLRF